MPRVSATRIPAIAPHRLVRPAILLLGALPLGAGSAAAEPVSYYRDVRPVFEAQCIGCHQPAKAKGDYVMTDFAKMLAGAEAGPSVVPGKPEDSHLVKLITPGENGEAEMPQKKPALHPVQIDLVKRWIAEGAKDDTPADAGVRYSAEKPPVYGAPPAVTSLDWSPDGKWIAAAGHSEILLHHADGSGLAARLIGLSERVESVAFSPDGKLLAAAGGNPARRGEIQVWNVADRSLKFSHLVTFDTLYGVSWSPDGKFLAYGAGDHGDNTVRAMEVATGKEMLSNNAHGDWALDTTWSVDGSHLVSVGRDMAAKLIEFSTQRFVDNITSITPGALRGGLHGVARHPQRDEVLLGGADGVPQVYRMHRLTKRVIGDNANLIRRWPAMPGRILALAWHPDGKSFAAVSSNGTDGLLRTHRAEYDPALPGDLKGIHEKEVAGQSAEERKKVEDYVTAGAEKLAELQLGGDRLFAVDYNPDGTRIAAAGSQGMVHIVDSASAKVLHSFPVIKADPAALTRARPAPQAELPPVAKSGELPEPAIDPGSVTALEIQPADVALESFADTAQVLVTARLNDGTTVDATRHVTVETSTPAVSLTKEGRVKPKQDGSAQVKFTLGSATASLAVTVKGHAEPLHPDYVRDVMPVMSRTGCNNGTCHGALDGKNGFKLSLRGYDPEFDVLALTDEQASRRANPAVPDSSFFLQKASAAVPHEGGQLTVPGEDTYEILRAWIADGGKWRKDAPRVTGIEVFPQNPVVQKIGGRQQVRIIATYADGKKRDVTHLAFIESGNTDVASTRGSMVYTLRRGEAPVLARFEGSYAATTVTVMGDRSGFVWQEPEAWSEIDRLVAAKWQRMKIEPSGLSTDAEFLRRVHLDLTGLPPTPEVVTAFLADARDTRTKRTEMIDRLIGSPDFVEHWSNKLADLLQVNGKFLAREGAQGLRDWIRGQVEQNTPWNKLVHSIVTASGSNRENPPAAYYKILRTPEEVMENTTHLFLGTRFNCNKCHDHPFERWTQDQYYQTAAWFAQVERKSDPESKGRTIGGTAVEGAQPLFEITADSASGEVLHNRTKLVTAPAFPYTTAAAKVENAPAKPRREQFADWLVAEDNRYFALSFVNRIWGYLLGTGLIEPLDDIRAGNPPSNPELLDLMRREFIASGFDLRKLIRAICTSRTYQLSVATNRWNEEDTVNFSHALARRLPAESLYDTIMAVTGAKPNIPGVAAGTRAAALPDAALDLPSGFLANLGRPVRESACECERSNDVQLGPVMSLLGGPVVADAIEDNANAIAALTRENADDRALVEKIFFRVLSRPARPDEVDEVLKFQEMQVKDHEQAVKNLAEAETGWTAARITAEVKREEAVLGAKKTLEEYEPQSAANQKAASEAREKAIQTGDAAVKARDEVLAAGLNTWTHPQNKPEAPVWRALRVKEATANNGVELQVQPDNSVLAAGAAVNGDYTLQFEPQAGPITGFIVEVLPDDRLPSAGPGRAPNGNFVLNQITLSRASNQEEEKNLLKFSDAAATFVQENFDPKGAIGDNLDPNRGWAIVNAPKVRQSASFRLQTPLESTEAIPLRAVLRFRFPQQPHTFGKFRCWVTSAADPLPAGIPEAVKETLGVPAEQRTPEQRAALIAEAGLLDPARGDLLKALDAARIPVPPDAKIAELKAALAAAEKPVPVPPKIERLRQDVAQSIRQMADRRLTAAQDLAWALINSPEFLFNH